MSWTKFLLITLQFLPIASALRSAVDKVLAKEMNEAYCLPGDDINKARSVVRLFYTTMLRDSVEKHHLLKKEEEPIYEEIEKFYLMDEEFTFDLAKKWTIFKAIRQIFDFRMDLPRHSRLLTAILDSNAAQHPTVEGFSHYLQGKCRLGNHNLDLPGMKFSKLLKNLGQQDPTRDFTEYIFGTHEPHLQEQKIAYHDPNADIPMEEKEIAELEGLLESVKEHENELQKEEKKLEKVCEMVGGGHLAKGYSFHRGIQVLRELTGV